jgi:hypothetical protein
MGLEWQHLVFINNTVSFWHNKGQPRALFQCMFHLTDLNYFSVHVLSLVLKETDKKEFRNLENTV